jgi:hypothetical protein
VNMVVDSVRFVGASSLGAQRIEHGGRPASIS